MTHIWCQNLHLLEATGMCKHNLATNHKRKYAATVHKNLTTFWKARTKSDLKLSVAFLGVRGMVFFAFLRQGKRSKPFVSSRSWMYWLGCDAWLAIGLLGIQMYGQTRDSYPIYFHLRKESWIRSHNIRLSRLYVDFRFNLNWVTWTMWCKSSQRDSVESDPQRAWWWNMLRRRSF